VDFTDGPYYNFTRSQIIAPGVRMIPAPGHTYGHSIVIAEDGGLFYMFHGDISYTDEAIYADKLSIVYDHIHMTRSTQNTMNIPIFWLPTTGLPGLSSLIFRTWGTRSLQLLA